MESLETPVLPSLSFSFHAPNHFTSTLINANIPFEDVWRKKKSERKSGNEAAILQWYTKIYAMKNRKKNRFFWFHNDPLQFSKCMQTLHIMQQSSIHMEIIVIDCHLFSVKKLLFLPYLLEWNLSAKNLISNWIVWLLSIIIVV